MSPAIQPLAEPRDASSQHALGARDTAQQPLTVAEALALPALVGPDLMQRLFQVGHSRFARLNREGAYDFLKVTPAVGPKCFSGVLIARYLCQEPIYLPSFGRKR